LGGDASADDIKDNIDNAIMIGCAIRMWFPMELTLFVPHENQVIAHMLWEDGLVDSDDILDACCKIVGKMDLIIVYDYVSAGMQREIDVANKNNIPIIYIDNLDDNAKTEIAICVSDLLLRESCKDNPQG